MSIKSWIFLENDDAWAVKVGTRIEFEVGRVSFERYQYTAIVVC